MKQFLVIDLDYNEVRGVFATPQESEKYVDTIDERKFRSAGYIITPVVIEDGKIVPQEPKDLGDDDAEVSPGFLKRFGLADKEEKDDLDSLFNDDPENPLYHKEATTDDDIDELFK